MWCVHGTGKAYAGKRIKGILGEKNAYIREEKVAEREEEWKKQVVPVSYDVTRQKGTERAFSGKYWNNHKEGIYSCICCDNDLFISDP